MSDIFADFAFAVPNQPFYSDGKPGPCSPSLNNVNLLVGWAYQAGYFSWTLASAGSDLVSPAQDTKVELFASGLGDTVPGLWMAAGAQDTNLPEKQEGAPVCRGNIFIATGIIVEALFPFERAVVDSLTSGTLEQPWLKDGQNGPGYGSRIQRTMLNRVSITIKHNNPVVEYPVGIARFWPGWPNVSGNAHTTNGNISVVGFVPFAAPIWFGSKDDCRQLGISLKYGTPHTIKNDASQPTPTVVGNSIFAGISVLVVGKVCTDAQQVMCVAPTLQPGTQPAVARAPTVTPPGRVW